MRAASYWAAEIWRSAVGILAMKGQVSSGKLAKEGVSWDLKVEAS